MSWFSRHQYHSSRYERMSGEFLQLEFSDGNGTPGSNLGEDASWLRGVTGALAVVYLATGRDRDEDSGRGELEDRSHPSPDALAMEGEAREVLHQLIDALPPDAGSLIRGVYFEGLTLKEAGERIGISKAWASRLHSKTLQRLGQSLRIIGIGD
jgi:RNA polymerase sigma factor for flagellar operon FliA